MRPANCRSIAVNDKGRVVASYSNGRTLDIAEIPLASFLGDNMLRRLDGGAFEATSESGPPHLRRVRHDRRQIAGRIEHRYRG